MTPPGESDQDVSRWLPPAPEGADPQPAERAWPPQPPIPPSAPPPGTPPGWSAPPGPAWGQAIEPENKPANIGFALAITGAGVLVFSIGFLSIASLPLGIAGWVWGRKGVRKVESGETHRNETLARSAVIVGIITTVLSAIALVLLIVLFAVVDVSDDSSDDSTSPENDRSRASALVARL